MTKKVKIGDIEIGGGNPVVIQSMITKKTEYIDEVVEEINRLATEGCQIVRLAIRDEKDAQAIKLIKKRTRVPLVADIHFDYRLALEVIENGIDKVRINPGNIGGEWRIRQVLQLAKEKGLPVRFGINGGSLEADIYDKYGGVTSDALVESVMRSVKIAEEENFENLVISLKSSDVREVYEAYKKLSKLTDFPLHIGVTEAGTAYRGIIKSAMALGGLLLEGIGDTMRISLTADPIEEVKAAKEMLRSLGILKEGVEIISCPTCGRTEIDLIGLAHQVEKEFENDKRNIKIAVMGCVVNGPGEAREADYGVAGGRGVGILFKKGKIVKKVKEEELLDELKKLIGEDYNENN